MKCPECGYNSFDHLESCKKCGVDLTHFKAEHGLSGPLFAGRPAAKEAGTSPLPDPVRVDEPDSDLEPGDGDDSPPEAENALPLPAEESAAPPFLPSGSFPGQGPSLGSRLASNLVDLLLLTGIFALFILAGNAILLPGETRRVLPPLEEILILSTPYFLVLFFVCFGYFTFFHYLTGQTPGKMTFGLRVERQEGGDLLFSQAFLRSVGGLMALVTAGAGYLPIPLTRAGRGWNDRLAGSRVVRLSRRGEEEEGPGPG
ncbi:putative membrane protein YckC, RDD family [Desulfuromonas soudanensis]|uniref:Putative membrane protein YckC, RDD family n=1 Tax=Desulfuromonas soudanensis TaxID=1603606 RepID=A0A0M3QGI4_9BACT|nr:RDD family protein [Desulfuromonas soudanensis]ALC17873.1 putative membrane protein YckC, RDD family [Desulfuromonas soudanensis]